MAPEQVSDAWERGSPYEQYVGRWSRQVAPRFLSWVGVPAGKRWLDVGCGTGALSAAIIDHCRPASVMGVEPSEGFLKTARENLGDRVVLHQGSAAAIPLGDADVDVVVSGLVLNFVPDPRAALAEMARVTGNGGTVAAYVWDYAGKIELMRFFWDAAVELDPNAANLDEGIRFPLCRPDALEELHFRAGLPDVRVTSIEIRTEFVDFDDYWRPFLGGQGPAPAYAMSLDETRRARLRDLVRRRLPIESDGSISLTARAWACCANVPGRPDRWERSQYMPSAIAEVTTESLQAFADAWNRHDVDALMSFMSADCVFEASAGPDVCGARYVGRDAVRAGFAEVWATFPDAHWANARHFVSGDRGVSEWTFTGTRVDGTRVEVHGCDLFTFRDGKIALKNSYRKSRPPQSRV